MVTTQINGWKIGLKATRTMTCPAGTAYWIISAHKEISLPNGDPDPNPQFSIEAIWTFETRAIYGPPDVLSHVDAPDLLHAISLLA